ncbi:hypothetical protein [Algoriella sp.]|uniref:hypothetical protein n=1 Tax=Algoriella sp. TaxID=1872434 RepID=UPI001AFF187B|nr:hypothetical protein [Algoriella sp.]MBO6212759.1 hypothetical protein [Algoriella sp.]
MNEEELKIDVINKINQLKYPHIIEDIQKLIDFELSTDLYNLSEEQINRVKEAKEEYHNSEILNKQEANQEIEKWLNEK